MGIGGLAVLGGRGGLTGPAVLRGGRGRGVGDWRCGGRGGRQVGRCACGCTPAFGRVEKGLDAGVS